MILTSHLESTGREHHQETLQETGPCFAAAVGNAQLTSPSGWSGGVSVIVVALLLTGSIVVGEGSS